MFDNESSHNTTEDKANNDNTSQSIRESVPVHHAHAVDDALEHKNNESETKNKKPEIRETVKSQEKCSAQHHSNLAKIEEEIMHEELIGKKETMESKYLAESLEQNKGSSHRIENILNVASSADEKQEENKLLFQNAVKHVVKKRFKIDDFTDDNHHNFMKYEVKERKIASKYESSEDKGLRLFLE